MDLMGLLAGAGGGGGDELDTYELDGGGSVVGEDVLGALVGAIQAMQRRGHAAPTRPRWRRQLAPGVPVPDYGVFPVPLSPQTNNGTFTATIANIEYRTTAQVPFRGERLLTRVARVGATAAGAIVFAQNGIFIGIRPQIGVLGALPLEDFSAQAFGVRLVMQQATQGADVRAFTFIQPLVTGTDTLTMSIQILGRVAR
jgi:hypothetical protein